MAKYLIQASYVGEGVKGLLKDGGTQRRASVEQMLKSVDGKMESFYFAFGDSDVFIVADLPDNATAAAIALKVNAAGIVRCKTTVLMTPDEVDAATKMDVTYKPPGG
ncbi:GYD domain-containing protein [Noviherbaspirillum saxi]|uniref:GYD domain-containing protein n=1 Tax=Noviherbaspirillum saxi TaxID=2320863 RepID=A0A3A3FLN6_9BURK|nr:GYD domain-containing protein [Noviherbaspirillum saxi]RJF92442.1 GYD domain-containing protein [Noviherbaspirillum saxi]